MNILQLLQSLTQKNNKDTMLNPIVNPAYTEEQRNPTPPPSPTPATISNNGSSYGRNPATAEAPTEISSAIQQAAKQFDIPAALLFDIAMSENSLKAQGQNKEGSTSSGAFQFNDPTWETVLNYARNPKMSLNGVMPNEDKNDPISQALAAAYLIKFGQLGRWDASKNDQRNKNSWGQYWKDEELNKLGFYNQTK